MPHYRENRREVYDRDIHLALRNDLMKHIHKANIQRMVKDYHDDLFEDLDFVRQGFRR